MKVMTIEQEARRYIDLHGVDKAKRLIENVVYDAKFYSEQTGSYYLFYQEGYVSLKHLRKAVFDYERLEACGVAYITRLKAWRG